MKSQHRLIVVSGLSGAGKSVAMHALEDLGYYCIDNLPANLLPALVAEMGQSVDPAYQLSAVAIDARNPAAVLKEFAGVIDQLREQSVVDELVFLDANDESLIKRFSETRRKHPLTAENVSLAEAIRRERTLLDPVRRTADILIDTSRTNLHQLRDLIRQRVDKRAQPSLSLLFQSFGYKHGVPQDADVMFDARCLPNPYWVPELKPLTGKDRKVVEFLQAEPIVEQMVDSIKSFVQLWVPRFELENRTYLTIAIGCTGGRHRSVYLVERLFAHFREQRDGVLARHRDLG